MRLDSQSRYTPVATTSAGVVVELAGLGRSFGHNSRRRASRAMDLKSRDWSLAATKIGEIGYTCGCLEIVGLLLLENLGKARGPKLRRHTEHSLAATYG